MLLSRFRTKTAAALRPHPSSSCRRWRSSIHACQSGRFSILTEGSPSKQAILDQIKRDGCSTTQQVSNGPDPRKSDSAVILASRDYATWLDDPGFMGSLVHQFFGNASHGSTSHEVSILSAVVDGLCPLHPSLKPNTGLSILYGARDEILPDLWVGKRESSFRAPDVQASISVSFRPLLGDFHPLQVTVPLAQTIFMNGRPSTLLASRWVSSANGPFELRNLMEKESQAIIPSLASIQAHASVSVPLYPVTAPRKIVAGLGNIVRQVEIDGKASPASQELEAQIPALLDKRAKLHPDADVTPVAVWALIIPESLKDSDLLAMATSDPATEQDTAANFAHGFSNLLASGCHLHRVLSGGGGWGAKQGLLSLDPQTRHTAPAEDDIESFISSFKGESTSDSIVSPGSYVQFFVQPITSGQETTTQHGANLPSIAFGTYAGALDDLQSGSEESIRIVGDHFGAVTSHGIFVEPRICPESGEQIDLRQGTHTKVDAPNSYIWESHKRWV